jgi:hypothetical protein
MEVTSGLRADASLIDSPPDSILDGQEVRVAATTPPSKGAETKTAPTPAKPAP